MYYIVKTICIKHDKILQFLMIHLTIYSINSKRSIHFNKVWLLLISKKKLWIILRFFLTSPLPPPLKTLNITYKCPKNLKKNLGTNDWRCEQNTRPLLEVR